MRYGKRQICITVAICTVLSFFAFIPSYASQKDASKNDRPELQKGNAALTTKVMDAIQARYDEGDFEKVPAPAPAIAPVPENDESLWYSEKLPLKKEHQKLLWDYCNKRNLDYIDMLALIYTESNFNETCSTGVYKGYFQINKAHGTNLAKTLKTLNKPLDGTININWGTAMYSWILADKRVKDLEEGKKRDVALSIFQRGTGGYDKKGISHSYLETYYKKRSIVCSYFEKSK